MALQPPINAVIVPIFFLVQTFLYYIFIKHYKDKFTLKQLLGFAILLRIPFFLIIPVFNEESARNLWDGLLVSQGINPYLMIPDKAFYLPQLLRSHYSFDILPNVWSKVLFSTNPPLSQLFFAIPFGIFKNNIFLLLLFYRVFYLGVEILIIFVGQRILNIFKKNPSDIYIFSLNPLLYFEVFGNIQVVAIPILCLLLSILFLTQKRIYLSALFMAVGVGFNWMFILFIPFVYVFLTRENRWWYYGIIVGLLALFYLPFLNIEALSNHLHSINNFLKQYRLNSLPISLINLFSSGNTIYQNTQIYGMIVPLFIIAIIGFFNNKIQKKWGEWFKTVKLAVLLLCLIIPIVNHNVIFILLIISVFHFSYTTVLWTLMLPMLYYFNYGNTVIIIEYVVIGVALLIEYKYESIKKAIRFFID